MFEELDVNDYCLKLSKSQSLGSWLLALGSWLLALGFRLLGWTGRWSLFGGFMLCCLCLSTQTALEAGQPFRDLLKKNAETHRP
ncbi:hypothetical protein AB7M18_000994 [Pseudomonas viridiflava]